MSKMNNLASADANVKTVKKENKTACRLFSGLFLLVSAVALFFLPYAILSAEAKPLYQAVLDSFAGWYIVRGPLLNAFYNLSMYAFMLSLIATIVVAVIGIINGNYKFANAAGIVLTAGAFVYTIGYTVAAFIGVNIFGIEILSLILAIAALIATIVCFKVTKPIIEVIKEEPKDDGFHVEEFAEAYPYEGGPVAGVVMAEEVNPSFIPQSPRVTTAGYDFYNSKAFDPFISTLTDQERNAFTELFILKVSGTMPELPDYVVGGDNKEFFRKVFIYLGQYRDRIPSDLLGKMYQFSLKIS